MIITAFLSLLAFLGSILGQVLAKIAKEEIPSGKKYFKIARKVFLFLLAFILLNSIWQDFTWLLPFAIGIIIGKYLKKTYLYFGFSLVAASINIYLLYGVAVLIFLYGLPYGSMEKEVIKQIPYFVVPLLLLITPTLITTYATTWLALLAGSLLLQQ